MLKLWPQCLKNKLESPNQTFFDEFLHMEVPVLAVQQGHWIQTRGPSRSNSRREREREREREKVMVLHAISST